MPAATADELRPYPAGSAVPAARVIAVMGPSGPGKSTLMHCLAGLDTLTEGRALPGGTDLSALDDSRRTQLRRTRIGFVFQAFNLLPMLTAAENITRPADLAGIRPEKTWVDTVIEITGLAGQGRAADRPAGHGPHPTAGPGDHHRDRQLRHPAERRGQLLRGLHAGRRAAAPAVRQGPAQRGRSPR